jgi:hypothetical protein
MSLTVAVKSGSKRSQPVGLVCFDRDRLETRLPVTAHTLREPAESHFSQMGLAMLVVVDPIRAELRHFIAGLEGVLQHEQLDQSPTDNEMWPCSSSSAKAMSFAKISLRSMSYSVGVYGWR